MARKTRRSKRRQRGGQMSRGKALAVGATAALAVLPPAKAQSLGTLVYRWATDGGWQNSKNLADALLLQDLSYPDEVVTALTDVAKPDAKPNGTETLPPEEKGNLTSSLNASQASNITTGGPLPEGNYSVGLTSGELTPYTINGSLPGDISPGTTVFIVKTREEEDYDEDDNPITVTYYDIQKESDKGDPTYKDRIFSVRADEVTLTPKTTGARRRTRRRKTLRRKK